MSGQALRSLEIAHLRGAVTPFSLPFEKGKKLTIIYGENGTGKSTICDALEMIGAGSVGSLEGRGLGKHGQYWHSLGKSPADVAVTLSTPSTSWCARIGKSGLVVTPSTGRPRMQVLRRKHILALLEATPGQRYEAIRRFIDVSNVEAAEATLREAIKSLEAGQSQAIARIQELRETLHGFWQNAGKPASDPFSWATAASTREPGEFDAQIAALERLRRCYERLNESTAEISNAQRAAESASAALDDAKLELAQSLVDASTDASDVVALLQAAQSYLVAHEPVDACPLCDGIERAAGLGARVRERLASLAALTSAQRAVAERRSGAEQANRMLEN